MHNLNKSMAKVYVVLNTVAKKLYKFEQVYVHVYITLWPTHYLPTCAL